MPAHDTDDDGTATDRFDGTTPAIVRADGGEDLAIEVPESPPSAGSAGATPGESDETADDDGGADVPDHRRPRHPVEAAVLDDVASYFADAAPGDLPFPAPDEAFVAENWFDFDYLAGCEEIERYWVNEPFAYVAVVYDEADRERRYRVVEPSLDLFEQFVREDLVTLLRNSLMYVDFPEGTDREERFMAQVRDIIETHAATVEEGTLHKLLYYLRRDFVHYGPIDAVMRDRNIEDISCDGVDVPVFVYHREYRDLPTTVSFDKRRLTSFTVRLAQRAGKQISVSSPLVDASLPDGSRVQLTLGGEISTRGANFTIRKFADIPYTPVDLVNWNTFSVEQMAYFWLAIENNKSLVFAGGTGSGKTTSMNAVSFFVPPNAKVVSIEDTREIDLPHDNWIQSVTRPSLGGDARGEVTTFDLLEAALRQRPEYLLVGEIRTEQRVALTFFQAMGTGHTCYTTLHADSVETVLSRLRNPPLSVPAQMLQDLDIVAIQRQTFLGDRRVRRSAVTAELLADSEDADAIEAHEVFRWDPTTDVHESVGESAVLADIAYERGWSDEELRTELAAREAVLRYLIETDVTGYPEVAGTVRAFAKEPEVVLDAIEAGSFDPSSVVDRTVRGTAVVPDDDRLTVHDEAVADDDPPRTDRDAEQQWERVVADAGANPEAEDRDE